ncbi:hypothetical protein [Sandaracinus amylolyticus]|uniref:hypothetical protein n=1 Tax=Sandaracinus amylolyticus TaxID=927083 RepID=UPI001F22F15F|nr:hypothetical protein [Sandaracinus amylolyticus]UJR81301.1 Hypothetical protein I5071_33580 [Sandaracinus amylolyticus]
MTRALRLATAALAATALVACNERPLTQLIVVTDTDLAIPAEATAIEIEVTAPDGTMQRVAGDLSGDAAITIPATLGVVHRGGALGPVEITARALHESTAIVERRARAFMVTGHTLVLTLHLERGCAGVACAGDTTCEHGTCRAVLVDATELQDYDGTIPRLAHDGSVGDGCLGVELCNGVDDDCDDRIDEGIDLQTNAMHCGACDRRCPAFGNSTPACIDGECGVACSEGFGDCDLEVRTGCETPLDSLTMCGECGRECAVEHGTPDCFGTVCAVQSCAPGFRDCDDRVENGCEQRLDDLVHCGACGVHCEPANAAPSCAGGTCGFVACEPGFASCDGLAGNGCEVPIDTVTDCGACDVECPTPANGSPACIGGRCAIGACETGWGDCNGMVSDGCETRLDTLADCGTCGRACALLHASETCSAGTCEVVACDGGWGDCDAATPGCETSLETASHCGTCDVSCVAPAPLCSEVGGVRACRSACGAGETLCGTECADLGTSLDHCGGCDQPCAPAHATAQCATGACSIAACDPGWDDCDGRADNGCETPLDTLTDCGGCDVGCDLPGANETCAGGRCAIATCEPGTADCDGTTSTGCETPLDTLTDCGGCGVACALANAAESCASGTCTLGACEPGWGDCNGMASDGCETPLDTLTSCGACGIGCDLPHASDACTGGTCTMVACDPEWGDCDAAMPGCEQSLRTLTSCGACNAACGPFPNATATCASGTCEMACNALFGDCSAAMPGCETRLDSLTSCGACGARCTVGPDATATCSTGTCAIATCTRADRRDCNGRIDDGCETRILDDENHCGACGTRCGPRERCRMGRCVRD